MQVEIVTIGNEILSGRTLDTNFAMLARMLEEASVKVAWHSTVGDTQERIAEGLARALDRADAVVMTGGLGPTPDDVTRKAVATVLGRPLQLDEAVLATIRERGRRLGRKLPSTVETMALIPRGAEVWPNSAGSAPGLLLVHRDKPVMLLPGVPYEMEAIAHEHLLPYLRARTGRTIETFTLRTYGAFESQLHERIGALDDAWPGASLAYLPSSFGVDLRVTVSGPNPGAVRETSLRAYNELYARVKPVVYAEGTIGMEEVLGAILVEKQWRIAAAESCTGGLLLKRLTDVPGSSRYVDRGFVTYSNEAKLEMLGVDEATLHAQGAVSAAVAEQMARGAAERAGVEVGVGITGVAGPDGGSENKPVGLVFVAIVSPLGKVARMLRLQGSRSTIRERAAQAAMDLLASPPARVAGGPLAGLTADRDMNAGGGKMRLFLAVFPPPAVSAAVMDFVYAQRTRGDGVAWVRRENLHYTLRFLGDMDSAGADAAAGAAREAAAAHTVFGAALAGPGTFPHAGQARVLWLGMSEGAEPLRALAHSLEAALVARGFTPADRPFAPHLTIGRLRAPADWSAPLAAARPVDARFRVERLTLVRSTLAPGGSRYETIAEARLAG